jgi:hypothetical protein
MKETTTMSDTISKETLDKKMRQIESLLARADHASTPAAEAASARLMAERLMVKYRIEQEDLIKSGDLKTDVIDVQSVWINYSPMSSEFSDTYRTLLSFAIHHTGCLGVYGSGEVDEFGNWQLRMRVFGYEADIRYATMLFNNARLLFADRMEPKPDPSLSDADNVYRMRSAGMERIRIADMMGWGRTNSATAKVTRLYKAACKARGEDATLTGRGNSVTNFRDVYVDQFTTTFWTRLWEARQATDAEIREGGLVLHDRQGRVQEAVYVAYPRLRPAPVDPNAPKPKIKARKYRGPTKKDIAAMERRMSKAGQAGARAGTAAANEVTIQGQTPKRRLSE